MGLQTEIDRREPPPAATPRKAHAVALFAGLGPGYDRMGAVLSLGQEASWRRALVERTRAGTGDRVLDVATGTGLVAAELVRAHGCRVVGVDQSEPMLAVARERLAVAPDLLDRVELRRAEAERLPFADGEFDALTFTYLLRYVDDPGATLRELARVLRPGGRMASVEFGVPSSAALRALWRVHTRAGLPALGRLVSRDWYEVGRFLGPSIEGLYRALPLEAQRQLWEQAGMSGVEVRRMSFGAGVVMSGTRDGDREA
jgi:demethylmenaquinone methyltransferase/2-methoxy-6-polyprenyl-1,4-benzoquinol methylase